MGGGAAGANAAPLATEDAMIIDTHAHVVPGTMLEALRSEKRLFPSVVLHADGPAPRLAFAGSA
ncbi:MAG: hypothetical protein JO008_02325, partial [Alphaproteobacteria bacterium]|nr:hypothetical protein [Alphaproteobacteria bacterium]